MVWWSLLLGANPSGEEPMREAKPSEIATREVWEADTKVRANQGAAGVDEQSMAEFDPRAPDHLDQIWNRLAAGSSFPPPVRTVTMPQANGGERTLGRPTGSDRIAPRVVQLRREPAVDPRFPPDASGYCPGQSALEAVGPARQRGWTLDWVIDLEIQGFFDTIDHERLRRAVKQHAKDRWVVRYLERWLQAPAPDAEGQVPARGKGTPPGGVISPLLANLFLH